MIILSMGYLNRSLYFVNSLITGIILVEHIDLRWNFIQGVHNIVFQIAIHAQIPKKIDITHLHGYNFTFRA